VKIVIRILKTIGIILASLAGFTLLYFATEYCLSRITVNKEVEPGNYATIHILTNGAHTDLVLPIRTDVIDWGDLVNIDYTRGKDHSAEYVAFGWGDKGFFYMPTWDDLTIPLAFKAVFWLNSTAMHVTFYPSMTVGDDCKSMRISREQYENLVGYVLDRFEKDENGDLIHIDTGSDVLYGYNDTFYEAVGRYNLFFTCNTWTNQALKKAGQKAAVWTIFDTGIFYHYQEE